MLPRLQRLVDAVTPNVASIYDIHFDYLVWNTPYVRVRPDPGKLPNDRRNLLWMMFTDAENRARMVRWEPAARAVLSQFRAVVGQRPDDPRFAEIVVALTEASPEFQEWWAEYPIRYFRPATIGIDHPQVGRVALEMFQFRPVEHADLLMVMQVPASDDDLQRVTSLLEHPTSKTSTARHPPGVIRPQPRGPLDAAAGGNRHRDGERSTTTTPSATNATGTNRARIGRLPQW